MTYKQTLDYLFSQLPMYQRIGAAAYKKDLTNTLALCAHLGNPERNFRSIHIAGTNGKGSVSHFIAAILQAAGYKVGLYVSPHYVDFRERIKVNGSYIPKRAVTGFVKRHRAFLEELQPSFFEMTVGLAFDHFSKEKVDFAVIETGLGGRLDSTNVITPVLSVITNISWDHMAMLGNTLPLIAAEKAGIIKSGVPVVIGEYQEEVWPVFENRVKEVGNTSLTLPVGARTNQNESGKQNLSQPTELPITELLQELSLRQILPSSPAQSPTLSFSESSTATPHWLMLNIRTALTAIEVLNNQVLIRNSKVTPEHIVHAMTHLHQLVRFMGRWQVIGHAPTILCDSAHNEAGLKYLWGRVAEMQFDNLYVVCGFANDKDLSAILPLFPKDAIYCFAKANVPRGLASEILQKQAADLGLRGKPYKSVNRALSAAKKLAAPQDLILVTGSIFVLGEVFARLPEYR